MSQCNLCCQTLYYSNIIHHTQGQMDVGRCIAQGHEGLMFWYIIHPPS